MLYLGYALLTLVFLLIFLDLTEQYENTGAITLTAILSITGTLLITLL